MLLTFPLITISAFSLITCWSTHFEYEFVFSVTSNSMPLFLRATALWVVRLARSFSVVVALSLHKRSHSAEVGA